MTIIVPREPQGWPPLDKLVSQPASLPAGDGVDLHHHHPHRPRPTQRPGQGYPVAEPESVSDSVTASADYGDGY
jgi:hypothetical protein